MESIDAPQPLEEAEPGDLETTVLRAFEGASPRAPGLREMLTLAAGLYSRREVRSRSGNGELIIDIEALVSAAFVHAVRSSRELNSARWFTESLQPSEDFVSRKAELVDEGMVSIWQYLEAGMPIRPSASVRSRVLPRALDLARKTVGRDEFDQRHLLMAILELPLQKWPEIGRSVAEADLEKARQHIVRQLARTPERGEDIGAWGVALEEALSDRLPAQRDDPASVDRLGRRYFAEVLASRIHEVRQGQNEAWRKTRSKRGWLDYAFMLHLDGAWGTGKSSVLNFIEADLRNRQPQWLIVRINAWRDYRVQPPWWGVISEIATQLRTDLPWRRRIPFTAIWWWWRLRTEFAPIAFAAILLLIGVLLLFASPEIGAAAAQVGEIFGQPLTVPGIIGILTTIGGLAGLGRSIFFGSSSTATAMATLGSDPYAPVMRMFRQLVKTAHHPILVVIDDIDRCNGDYVVDLLENIQTMLREVPITYLVAGDRKWIATSFERRFDEFSETLKCDGRPLGHLFLEKVFQLSVTLPEPTTEDVERYWRGIVNGEAVDSDEVDEKRAEARAQLQADATEGDMQRRIRSTEDAAMREALVAEAAIRVSSAEFGQRMESRYARYGSLLDRNPRSLKRLVNKMALNQMMLILAERDIEPGPLARWTALELRWPLVAEALREKPELLEAKDEDARAILTDDIRKVLGTQPGERLDTRALRVILGLAGQKSEAAEPEIRPAA